MASTPSLSAEEHQAFFTQFVRHVEQAGGATPHMRMVAHAARFSAAHRQEAAWMGGCYAAVYNYAAAEALWSHLSLASSPEAIRSFVTTHWAHLPLRRERKAVNSPAKLSQCLISLTDWVQHSPWLSWGASYETAWESFQSIYGMGRYVSIRFLEFARLALDARVRMPDIRPAGATYPRQGLSLLYPSASRNLWGSDDAATLQQINLVIVPAELRRLAAEGLEVDPYTLQSLICEYKQSVLGGKQWPGKSLDSELVYWDKVYGSGSPFDPSLSAMYAIRSMIFPSWALGEVDSKWKERKALGPVLRDHGYVWSDSLYSWHASRDDLADPVAWPEPLA